MRRFALFALLLMLPALGSLPARLNAADLVQARPYATASQVDLVRLVPPPPDAEGTRRELDAMLSLQKRRSPAEEVACQADAVISVFRFADVLGDSFTPQALPKTSALFERALASSKQAVDPAKDAFARLRPPLADRRIKPCVKLPLNGSYPSGHSTAGNLMATLLADMLPEKAAQLSARGRLFGDHRVLAGVHFPSDVDAGRLCAAALAQALFMDPQFQAEFQAARSELRKALGFE
jgi:acid phosphatase (class A)